MSPESPAMVLVGNCGDFGPRDRHRGAFRATLLLWETGVVGRDRLAAVDRQQCL